MIRAGAGIAIALASTLLAGCSGCSGCSKQDETSSTEPVAPPSAVPNGSSPAIDAMVQKLGPPLVPQLGDGSAKGDLLLFPVKGKEARQLVLDNHKEAFDLGAYLFLFRPNADEAQALLGLAPTKDALEAVRIVGTKGKNPPRDSAAIVQFLTELDRMQPFGLSGIGIGFVEGGFDGPVKDPAAIAAKVNAFCPEFATNLAAAHDEDAHQAVQKWFAANRNFYFTWD
jgi:hypothetical protein